jgi:hypothetical protein
VVGAKNETMLENLRGVTLLKLKPSTPNDLRGGKALVGVDLQHAVQQIAEFSVCAGVEGAAELHG